MKKKTKEEFLKEAKEKHGDKYDYSLVIYSGIDIKIKIICPEHGIFEQTPYLHLCSKCGCPKCSRKYRKITKSFTKPFKQFIKEAKEKHCDKYDYSNVEYINAKTNVKIICPVHGEFLQTPANHLAGRGCPKCSLEKQKKSSEQFIKEANRIHNGRYDYLQAEYLGSFKKVKIICPEHGIFEQTPDSHLRGSGCPKCKSSHGENKIRNILQENNVLFEEQKKFKDLKDVNMLSYDFYIPSKNLLIEYNGIQHYETKEHFGGEKALRLQQHHDWLKRKFAKDNNFTLLTISYKDDIKQSLTNFL